MNGFRQDSCLFLKGLFFAWSYVFELMTHCLHGIPSHFLPTYYLAIHSSLHLFIHHYIHSFIIVSIPSSLHPFIHLLHPSILHCTVTYLSLMTSYVCIDLLNLPLTVFLCSELHDSCDFYFQKIKTDAQFTVDLYLY